MKFEEVFAVDPGSWGLRGDPYLWEEMRVYFADEEIPSTQGEIFNKLSAAFERLTGASIHSREAVFMKRYEHGGMSSGHVSPEFWRTTVPAVIKNFHRDICRG